MKEIDVVQRSAQMLLPDLDGCYWVISVHENTYHKNVEQLAIKNEMLGHHYFSLEPKRPHIATHLCKPCCPRSTDKVAIKEMLQ